VTRLLLFFACLACQLPAARLQSAMASAMQGRAGAAIALEASSGRILAIYHPEVASRRLARPGSAIKPFTAMALSGSRTLRCHGRLEIAGRKMDCTHPASPEAFDAVSALAYSCNYYFATRAAALRGAELTETFTRAGLLSRTGLVAGEAVGELVPPSSVESRQLLALGESGIVVTPLALAAAYRKLALRKDPVIMAGLAAAAEYGTARLAQPVREKAAGKTGTASDPGNGRVHAWFAGWAPADSPRVVVVVFLEQGVGGRDAAPIAKELFEVALQAP
jgi:cell division protein FtsI/penicillin-binding protein 2